MSLVLTQQIAYQALQSFLQQKILVLFGTGTSCAVDTRFGMDALRNNLLLEVPKNSLNATQQKQWDSVVKNLDNGSDLEKAMNDVQDEDLTKIIIESTAKFVGNLDREYGVKIISGEVQWPAWPLFNRLWAGLPETDPVLHVATPNYDLLAEYAFEKAGIPYITGFSGGICRHRDWKQAKRSMTYLENVLYRRGVCPRTKTKKHIRLYKVHGSLNTFRVNNAVVENNSWTYENPGKLERIMITPGTTKYERLHQYRPELLGEHDHAVEQHNAFLFIGFGFNDSQLTNNRIEQKLREQKCPGLIITRDSNPRIESYITECENLWLVCKHQDNGNNGTRIFNSQYKDWLYINDKQLWSTEDFTKEILGG